MQQAHDWALTIFLNFYIAFHLMHRESSDFFRLHFSLLIKRKINVYINKMSSWIHMYICWKIGNICIWNEVVEYFPFQLWHFILISGIFSCSSVSYLTRHLLCSLALAEFGVFDWRIQLTEPTLHKNFCLVSNMFTKINNFHFFSTDENKNTFRRPNRKISSEFCFAREKLGFWKFICWMVECIMNTWEKENYEKKFHLDHIKMLKTRQVWLKRKFLTHSNTLHNPFCCSPVTFYYDYRRFLWKIWRNVLHTSWKLCCLKAY